MTYYIYILECKNGSYYTGYTTDLKRRYQEHLAGSAKCKYTRSFPPKRLAASWGIKGTLAEAMSVERTIKTLSRQAKENLITNPTLLCNKITEINILNNGVMI